MDASLIVAIAFFATMALIEQRTKRKAALWIAAIFGLIGGIALSHSDTSARIHQALGNMWGPLPGVLGCVLGVIIIIDLTDLKPNWPAAVSLCLIPTFIGAASDVFTSSGLPAAIALGLVAGIIQHRASGSSSGSGAQQPAGQGRRARGGAQPAAGGGGSKRTKMIRWLSIPIAFFGGLAFSVTEVANSLDRQFDKLNFDGSQHLRGAIGLLIVALVAIDLADGKPDKPATGAMYALPMFFFPAFTLIGVAFGMV